MKIYKSQTGFTPIMAVGIIVILSIIGFAGWRVYDTSRQKDSLSSSQTNTTSSSQKIENKDKKVEETKKPAIPEDFIEYSSKELGIKFAYPKEWGEASVKKSEVSSGEEQRVTFSKFAKFAGGEGEENTQVVLNTPDFRPLYPGEGHQKGFTNYKERRAEIESQDSQRKAGSKNYVTTILDDATKYMVYGGFDCLNGGYYVIGISELKNSKFAGFGIGYFKSFGASDPTAYCNAPPEKQVSEVVDKNVQKQLTEIVKTVQTL